MSSPSTTFQPYDRVTGTELSSQQQTTCRAYYLIIKAYIDGIEKGAGAPIPWTRKNLRCSTADLLELIERLADDIQQRSWRDLAANYGTSSIQSWAEAEGQKLAVVGLGVNGAALERYQYAVNLLHEFINRLARASDCSRIPLKAAAPLPTIPYILDRASLGSDSNTTLANATTTKLGGRRSVLSEAESNTILEAINKELPAFPLAKSHGASSFIDPWEELQFEVPAKPLAAAPTHIAEVPRAPSRVSGRWRPKPVSSWALEYLRGGWQSNSLVNATESHHHAPPPWEETSHDNSIRLLQRTDSDNVSIISDEGGFYIDTVTGGVRMKRPGRPIPPVASRLKGNVSFDVPDPTDTRISTASGLDYFKTPRSILSGNTIFATPDAGNDDLGPMHSIVRTTNTSAWNKYLRQKGLIPDPFEEMDWSGRGQHAEFEATEEASIPLKHEGNLGHSATALVDSVRCRRIRLARKTVHVSRRFKREEALQEVEHLQRLKHSHVIRVIGTYTLPRKLSILLYPVADYTLDEFLESVEDVLPADERATRLYSISTFLRCLAKAVAYIHAKAMKHMDIKPKNLLVRDMHHSTICNQGKYKIYIADFGIARSYRSVDDCNTETPTAYTRTYAAPEVVAQERRDQKADIFSLGAVYAEMLTALALPTLDILHVIRESDSVDRSYTAHAPAVQRFVRDLCLTSYGFESDTIHSHITELVALMLSTDPADRPTAATIVENIPFLAFCCDVNGGPEPFEAANRPRDRQLYDRAMEIAEADERYWRCSVEGCVKVYSSREKLEYHNLNGHGEADALARNEDEKPVVAEDSVENYQRNDWSTF